MDITLISFNFIPLTTSPPQDKLFEWIADNQEDEYLSEIGLESQSAIVNHVSFIATIILLSVLLLVVWP